MSSAATRAERYESCPHCECDDETLVHIALAILRHGCISCWQSLCQIRQGIAVDAEIGCCLTRSYLFDG